MASSNARKLPQTPDQVQHHDDAISRLEPATDPPPPPPAKNPETENAELRRVSTLVTMSGYSVYRVCVYVRACVCLCVCVCVDITFATSYILESVVNILGHKY